jgi:N6-L-threonylcarbamoyladenine synthase
MLNLGYPAGPVVEEFAKLGQAERFAFPLPMTTTPSFDLSYSGIKTHARNLVAQLETAQKIDQQTTYDLCAGLQKAVFGHLTYKLQKLLVQTQSSDTPFQAVWLGGGVAANAALRQALRITLKPFGSKLAVPYSKRLCGDNAAMIGLVGALKFSRGLVVKTPGELERQPRLALR